ncbi:MAG: hypothetical protein MJK04_02490, partial [Psychrosphaera sp.]|nr:hypothetical protein [Psychrosphaera sp.]
CALFYYLGMNVVVVRICFITVFLLFFTLQSVALAVEVDVVNAHDQIHHELENGHDESKHDSSSDQQHDEHHVHLCHHHHGEHAAKVFIQAPNLYSFFIDGDNAIGFSVHYDNIAPKSLYRPPIS